MKIINEITSFFNMDEIECYFEEMQSFQNYFLNNYLDNDQYQEELHTFLDTFSYIITNRYKLKCILHLITKISNNHSRSNDFWPKIEKILFLLKEDILKNHAISFSRKNADSKRIFFQYF